EGITSGFGVIRAGFGVVQAWAAVGAGDGLGVETAVGGIVVFAGAALAHRESGHGGTGPVVGQRGDDGEAGTAVGAVDERVPVPAVGGIAQFGLARGAEGDVRGGEGAAAAVSGVG